MSKEEQALRNFSPSGVFKIAAHWFIPVRSPSYNDEGSANHGATIDWVRHKRPIPDAMFAVHNSLFSGDNVEAKCLADRNVFSSMCLGLKKTPP